MASNGFSKAKSWWGTIAGLSPKSSGDGKTSSLAEAPNDYGDTVNHDVYGELLNPTTEYAVTAAVTLSSLPALGSIHTVGEGANAKKIMLTNVAVKTAANASPTVTLSGVEVEAGATAKRTYALTGSLSPRSKAQDVCGAFTASSNFTAIDTTFSVDPHVQTISGTPVASDCSHGKIEVSATMTDGDGSGSISASVAGGFTVTAAPAENDPDADYITRQATGTKFLTGTEASNAGGGVAA